MLAVVRRSLLQGRDDAVGDVVGQAATADGAPRAFLYRGGVMEDLNRLIPARSGWVLDVAYAINDRGKVVGSGLWHGRRHAFLLTRP